MPVEIAPALLEALLGEALVRARCGPPPRDPVAFAHACGFPPDPWQADLLRSDARQLLLNCSRQAGKSTVSAVLGLHAALDGRLVLLLAPALRQSGELMRKVKDAYRSASATTRLPAIVEESALRLELAGGGRVVSLPGHEETIRGFSGVGVLLVDEASRVPDALYYAVRPMLAVSGGRIVLLSTPFGRRGFFHKEWDQGGEDWHRVEVTAEQCPRIPQDWLERERAAIGEWWFKQEYGCAFVDTQDQVFRFQDVEAAYDDEVQPLDLPAFRQGVA